MTQAPLISFNDVEKSYASGVTPLKHFNLDVLAGETLTLLGPSGCGKSTALRLIAGLAAPTHGEIIWSGQEQRKSFGVVFQDPTLLPWASVFDNVYLPLRLAGVRRDAAERQVRHALTRVGLGDFATALPCELSGGMKMRCAIARALVTEPSVILMDEPFAALDEVTRFRLNDELLTLKQELQATIIFVTHSVYESAYLSTRIVVMSKMHGAIADEIDVDASLRRDLEFRHTDHFADICRRASQALRRATEEDAGAATR